MNIDTIKKRFAAAKERAVTHARVKVAEYKERKKQEREEERIIKAKERAAYTSALSNERVKVARQKGREKARGGFMGLGKSNTPLFSGRNIWETGNQIKPISFGGTKSLAFGSLNKDVLGGGTRNIWGSEKKKHHRKHRKAKHESGGKKIIIQY